MNEPPPRPVVPVVALTSRQQYRFRMKYGSAMSEGRPRGTVTFLFTDIEDSTRWWDEAPTDMAGALQVHDDIVRGAIESHGGYVFGTGGDGFSAAFSTAAGAATAAVASQQLLAEAD